MTPIDFSHQTTIVTGASSGIGAAFARELAGRGSDLVLVARRLDRLQALASELESAHGIRVTAIALDLSAPRAGRALAAQIADRGLSITGLVNNAGFGTDGPFHDEDPERLTEEINVDVANLVDITRAFIEPLRAAGTGILVNVASLAAYAPSPGMAVYAACKAFVLSFTEALWFEARGTGLRVLSLAPGLTRTEFFDELAGGSYNGSYQTPEQVVQTAMRVLDRGGRRPSVLSGRLNSLTAGVTRFTTRRRAVLLSGVISARAAGRESAKVG
ncbi:SDR family NAD(P)-dependent oxidoreductase [Conyzicola nivalis]|uniref:Dehydrogenase n=1 Tax=Conyzicola nivalis TaxID=1477021 RepID=A0A916SQI4_9MICO|nr:SDR family oxidoreductase [Conyzicola nivalis]GGB12536.1 dehydrogenase [Conyzicola nivalis]